MSHTKIGLLGGTFDPVHHGHLQLAETALKECGLDKVVFIPSAQPPHKNCASVTPFRHRLAMLTLAGEGRNGFECCAIESILPKPSYTIDTLRALREYYHSDCQLYFMIGADAFLDILTWKSHLEVLHSVNIILSKRKGYKEKQLSDLLKQLGCQVTDGSFHWTDCKKVIYLLEKTPDGLSSSEVRSKIRQGDSVQQSLPKSVIEYIQKHKLYQAESARKASSGQCGCQGNVE
ncbi:MAG: nicotinate (nicotinamide) nucleotide adenylyltransferase [Desulfobulbaceae bacterium]|nr:nicotinate (nicotinamide) nucleotide adenylyltransferase [Desulfobulbaceae bacterium]